MEHTYKTEAFASDFTPTHTKVEGAWENTRNAIYSDLYKDIIREAFGVQDTIIGHHLLYVEIDKREENGHVFDYQIVQEIPAADTLIFDHKVAKKIWGERFLEVLMRLACEPVDTRDALLSKLYYSR